MNNWLNEYLISKSGDRWDFYSRYNGFDIYKSKSREYYNVRKLDNTHLFNSTTLDNTKKNIDDYIQRLSNITK